MSVGDIHWADLPPSDGREQSGRRPVMLLQDEGYAGSLPTVIIVPITSSWPALRLPGTVAILAGEANGLAYDSVLLVFQIRALDRRRLRAQIGTAEPEVVTDVYDALDWLTGRNRFVPPIPLAPPPPPAPPSLPPAATPFERYLDL